MVLGAAQQKPGDRGRTPAAERDIEDDQQVGSQIQVLQKNGIAHQLKRQRLDGSRAQQYPKKARHRRKEAVQQDVKPRCCVTFCAAQKTPGGELVHLGCTGSRQRQQRRGQKREKIVGEFFHGGYLSLWLWKPLAHSGRWGREPDAGRNISDSRKVLSLRPCGATSLAEGSKKVVGKNFLNYTTPPCIL